MLHVARTDRRFLARSEHWWRELSWPARDIVLVTCIEVHCMQPQVAEAQRTPKTHIFSKAFVGMHAHFPRYPAGTGL